MKCLTVTQARKELYHLLESVVANHEPVQITGKRFDAVVIVAESDWRALQETLYLLSVPGMRENIKKGLETPIDECDEDVDW
jgi:antitoxin YefM